MADLPYTESLERRVVHELDMAAIHAGLAGRKRLQKLVRTLKGKRSLGAARQRRSGNGKKEVVSVAVLVGQLQRTSKRLSLEGDDLMLQRQAVNEMLVILGAA